MVKTDQSTEPRGIPREVGSAIEKQLFVFTV